jgi:hypothetical protein
MRDRNLNLAVHAVGRKNEINRPPEFMRDEIADQAGAVARFDVGHDRGTVALPPD